MHSARPRAPTDRLRHVAHLGVRARPFSYLVRGLEVPDGRIDVTLAAPSGEAWRWEVGASEQDDGTPATIDGSGARLLPCRHPAPQRGGYRSDRSPANVPTSGCRSPRRSPVLPGRGARLTTRRLDRRPVTGPGAATEPSEASEPTAVPRRPTRRNRRRPPPWCRTMSSIGPLRWPRPKRRRDSASGVPGHVRRQGGEDPVGLHRSRPTRPRRPWTPHRPAAAPCDWHGRAFALPEVIGEQGGELGRDESHLRGQLHRLLADVAQRGLVLRSERDDRLRTHGAVLGAPE